MPWTRLLAVAVLALAVCGCGSNLLRTRGRVVKGGAPFLPGPGEFVRVTFVPVLPAGKRAHDYYVAEYNAADGTFQVAGKDRNGMPPGRYRVAVELDKKRRDLLGGRFDADNSPFVYDVDAGTPEIVIDLDRAPARRPAEGRGRG
jgi:hypothetical protein